VKPSRISEDILTFAIQLVAVWENDGLSLDDCLDQLRESEFPEKAAVASLLFEYFRHKGFLDALLMKHAKKGKVNQAMRLLVSLAATQVFFQSGIPWQSAVNIAVDVGKQMRGSGGGAFVNAILRSYLRDDSFDRNHVPIMCPPMLLERWTKEYGEEAAKKISEQFASNPGVSIRLRSNATEEELAPFKPTPITADFPMAPSMRFYDLGLCRHLFESRLIKEGRAYVQDPATCMGLSMVHPEALKGNLLDMCAAPGGKTILMAEMAAPGSRIIAADRSHSRVMRMNANLRRAGLKIKTVAADARELPFPPESFDFVLADVPCSNTGVIRRRPDVPWRFSKNRLSELLPLQLEILRAAANQTKAGGHVLYSTCSLENEENTGRVQAFLSDHPDWELICERTLLPCGKHDGAYSALLHRKGTESSN